MTPAASRQPPIAFVCAMPMEAQPLVKRLRAQRGPLTGRDRGQGIAGYRGTLGAGREAVVLVTGMGTVRASLGVERLLDSISVAAVVVVGICGGVDATLPVGALVEATEVIDAQTGTRYQPRPLPSAALAAAATDAPRATGAILTTDELLTDPDTLSRLVSDGVVALDMETAAIVAACERRGVDSYVVRVISDRAVDGLVDDAVLHLNHQDGRPNPRAIAGYVGRHPTRIAGLARLARDTRLAATQAADAAIACATAMDAAGDRADDDPSAVAPDGVFSAVRDGYDAVYDAIAHSPTFARLWRTEAYGARFPNEFAHIGFLTIEEAERVAAALDLPAGATLADVACGTGGPGLWLAQRTGAALVGIDASACAIAGAQVRARATGLVERARFLPGTFERTGLDTDSVDCAVSFEAFQYAPDKRAALDEFARVLCAGARLAIVAFEVDPSKVTGVPVLGVDPVADYRPLLEAAGFSVEIYEETPQWRERVEDAFRAVVDEGDTLATEMGERAAAAVAAEASLTLALKPYRRRILAVARLPLP